MLQRIYGTAWESDKALKEHLHRLEEAEKRDHRKLAVELDLLSFPEQLGGGLAVWHPKRRHGAQAHGGLQPRAPRARRLRVRVHAAPVQGRAVRDERSPRLVRRGHVPADGDGQRRLLPEADELPDALPDLRQPAALVPGAAAAAVRAGQRLPLRAGRHAPRAHAHPRLHAGRRPHLLHARAGRGRDPARPQLRALGAAGLRLRRLRGQPVDARSGQVDRRRRRLGATPRSSSAGRSTPRGCPTPSRTATRPSTARRSTSTCATPSGADGSSRRSSSTSTCPSASSWSTSDPTTPGTGRS